MTSNPISTQMAEAIFIEAGLELLEPYGRRKDKKTGPSSSPLRARCTYCGYEGKRSLQQIRYHGNICVKLETHGGYTNGKVTGCVLKANLEEFRAFGMEPVDWATYKSTKTEVECRCITCGTKGGIALNRIRNAVKGTFPRHPCFRGSPCDEARIKYTCPEGCECNKHIGWRLLDPDKAAEQMRAVGYEPLEPYPGSEIKWKCRHSCGAVVSPTFHNAKGKPVTQKCSECRKVPVWKIAALLEAKELEPLDPSQLNGGATGLIDCVHLPCGEPTQVRYCQLKGSDTQAGSGGCVTCGPAKSGRAQWTSRADWLKAAEKAGMTLLEEPGPGNVPVLCECHRCGRATPTWYFTMKKGGGCASCNISASKKGKPTHGCGGFKKDQRGVLYLMSDRQGTLKVGITSVKNEYFRTQSHKFHGWHIVKTWEAPGRAVMRREQDVLRWWRDTLNAPMVKTAEDMPQGGWTETASTCKVGLQRTIDYIEGLREKV